ncbi:MAG: hypothetical protein G01um101413_152 [Parcubacteria group bacterium Gr01-1014_13]|nr:MAG: hypothetical protein G01um101413_152 [Parcubacteria group bacterium Gr01-1014_13]
MAPELSSEQGVPILYSAFATILSIIFILGESSNEEIKIKRSWIIGAFLLQLVLLYTIADGLMFGFMNWGIIVSTAFTAVVIIHRAIMRYRLVKESALPKAVARCRAS